MKIRRMTPEDVALVSEIERQSFSAPWSRRGFLDALAQECTAFFVAEESDDDIAGYVGMYVSLDEGEITNVAVKPDLRGKGIAKALLKELLSYANDHGITRIVLEVRVSNAVAIGLYEEFGFEIIGTRKGFYEFPREDAHIMVWGEEKC
jgi:ribosomal-protein-alanine N-acetyltransferase